MLSALRLLITLMCLYHGTDLLGQKPENLSSFILFVNHSEDGYLVESLALRRIRKHVIFASLSRFSAFHFDLNWH